MFSYLIVALFAVLAVLARPLPSAHSPSGLHTPSSVTDDGCSDVPTPVPSSVPSSAPTGGPSYATTPTGGPSYATSPTPAPPSTTPSTSVAEASTYTPQTTTAVSDTSSSAYTGGVATYYYQNGNAGACGQVNSDSAFICAMDQARFGTSGPSSSLCGQQVQITNQSNGKVVTVTIADDCPTCENENSIDLSVAAFEAIADLSTGEVPISWVYV